MQSKVRLYLWKHFGFTENFITKYYRTAEKESKNFVCTLDWIDLEPPFQSRARVALITCIVKNYFITPAPVSQILFTLYWPYSRNDVISHHRSVLCDWTKGSGLIYPRWEKQSWSGILGLIILRSMYEFLDIYNLRSLFFSLLITVQVKEALSSK